MKGRRFGGNFCPVTVRGKVCMHNVLIDMKGLGYFKSPGEEHSTGFDEGERNRIFLKKTKFLVLIMKGILLLHCEMIPPRKNVKRESKNPIQTSLLVHLHLIPLDR